MPINRLCMLLLPLAVLLGAVPVAARDIDDDSGRRVRIPDLPRRIVSLSDVDVTIPLIELGAPPVASHGRIGLDGKPALRSGLLLTGVDFSNSAMRFVGANDVDLEAVAAARPDLIITDRGRGSPIDALAGIAPVVVVDAGARGAAQVYRRLAEITGTQARLSALEARYRAGIQALRDSTDTGRMTVSVIQPLNGKISLYHTYRALGQVLRDAGFRFPALIDGIAAGGRIEVGADRLPDIDADIIFDPYRADRGAGGAQAEIAAMEALVPNFCTFLKACRSGRYVLVSREEAISHSYAALALMTAMVQAQVAARPVAR